MLFLYPNHYTFFFPEQFFEFYTFARLHSVTPEWVTRELIMQTSMRRRQRTYCNKTHQEKKKRGDFFFLTQLLMKERGAVCGGSEDRKK